MVIMESWFCTDIRLFQEIAEIFLLGERGGLFNNKKSRFSNLAKKIIKPLTTQYVGCVIPKPPDSSILDSQAPEITSSLHILDTAANIQTLPLTKVPKSLDNIQNITILPENTLMTDAVHRSIEEPILKCPAKVVVEEKISKKRKRSIFNN